MEVGREGAPVQGRLNKKEDGLKMETLCVYGRETKGFRDDKHTGRQREETMEKEKGGGITESETETETETDRDDDTQSE